MAIIVQVKFQVVCSCRIVNLAYYRRMWVGSKTLCAVQQRWRSSSWLGPREMLDKQHLGERFVCRQFVVYCVCCWFNICFRQPMIQTCMN